MLSHAQSSHVAWTLCYYTIPKSDSLFINLVRWSMTHFQIQLQLKVNLHPVMISSIGYYF